MDQELFNPQSSSVTSSRILYTPSTFARTSLLHLQEVGSLQAIHQKYSGVRPHKEKINISKEIINKTRGAVAPYAAQIFTHLSVVSSRQRSYDWLRCEGKSRG